jgi:hypothetical protein
MTWVEFDALARDKFRAKGATDIDIHPGYDLTLSCVLNGERLTFFKVLAMGNDQEAMASALAAIDAL